MPPGRADPQAPKKPKHQKPKQSKPGPKGPPVKSPAPKKNANAPECSILSGELGSAAALFLASPSGAAQLRRCVSARRPVYVALANYGPRAKATQLAVYKYLQAVWGGRPECRVSGGEGAKQSAHTQLMHM